MKQILTGRLVRLRVLERDDLPLVWKWQNDMEVMENLWQNPISIARLEHDFNEEVAAADPIHRRFVIEQLDGLSVGLIWYHNMNRSNRSCTLGLYIGEKERWGQGLGSDAIRVLLQYLFLIENMHYVGLSFVAGNERAGHVYEKCGFTREGVSRKWCFMFGQYRDLIHMSILEDEFRAQEERHG